MNGTGILFFPGKEFVLKLKNDPEGEKGFNKERFLASNSITLIIILATLGLTFATGSIYVLYLLLLDSLVVKNILRYVFKLETENSQKYEKIRLLQLSDGVFAISATLMIIDLGAPLEEDGDVFENFTMLAVFYGCSFFVLFSLYDKNHDWLHNANEKSNHLSITEMKWACSALLALPVVSRGFTGGYLSWKAGKFDYFALIYAVLPVAITHLMMLICMTVVLCSKKLIKKLAYPCRVGTDPILKQELTKAWTRTIVAGTAAELLLCIIITSVGIPLDPDQLVILAYIWIAVTLITPIVTHAVFIYHRKKLILKFESSPKYITSQTEESETDSAVELIQLAD